MWKGVEDRNIVVSDSFLSKVRAGRLFLEWVWKVAWGWDQGGKAAWFGYEKMGFIGRVSAIRGRRGAVWKCDRIRVTFQVL